MKVLSPGRVSSRGPARERGVLYLKIYSIGDYIKNDLTKYFMQYVRYGLIIHLKNSLENKI